MKNQIYKGIRDSIYSLQELCNIFDDLLPFGDKNEYRNANLIYVEALLLHFYNNNLEVQRRENLLKQDTEGKYVCPIKSKFEEKSESNNLPNCFNHIHRQIDFNDAKLDFLLDRIDLIKPMCQIA